MSWLLIAVLKSAFPLSVEIANRLYLAALDLHERRAGATRFAGDGTLLDKKGK